MATYIIQIFEENDASDEALTLTIEAESAEDALEKLQAGDAEAGEIDQDDEDEDDFETAVPVLRGEVQ